MPVVLHNLPDGSEDEVLVGSHVPTCDSPTPLPRKSVVSATTFQYACMLQELLRGQIVLSIAALYVEGDELVDEIDIESLHSENKRRDALLLILVRRDFNMDIQTLIGKILKTQEMRELCERSLLSQAVDFNMLANTIRGCLLRLKIVGEAGVSA